MAQRPIFIPNTEGAAGLRIVNVDFKWHPGMATSQKQKSIHELHSEGRKLGYRNILEISSKSKQVLGVSLSAFNLMITTKRDKSFSVECAFQASKVFENGGPFRDLLNCDSLTAKRDTRLKESGALTGFRFFNQSYPLTPQTFFYDWLYINALNQNQKLATQIMAYNAFSDIEFNPKKSLNCQAHSAALFVSLAKNNQLNLVLSRRDVFLSLLGNYYSYKTT